MTGNGKKFKLREETVVKLIIAIPIVILFLVVGGPAIWKSLVSIAKVIFPENLEKNLKSRCLKSNNPKGYQEFWYS